MLSKVLPIIIVMLLFLSRPLHANDTVTLALPPSVTEQITQTTLLFYFSPSCTHCQSAAPEIVNLVRDDASLTLIAVSSGSQSAIFASEFAKQYNIRPSELIHDADRSIATAMGVRSTPVLLVLEPGDDQPVLRKTFSPYQHGQSTLVKMALAENPMSVFTPNAYVGALTCEGCHPTEHASWRLTRHNLAMLTLVRSNSHYNDACVGCHVTGFNEPTGYDDKHRPYLADVGCESCHGPGGPHDGVTTDAQQTCATCHDKDHSIDFSVERALPFIDHNLINTLSQTEISERRNALYNGTLPRAIAHFSGGQTVGSDACADCHPAIVKSWAASDHAKAMDTLAANNHQTNMACVTCHATQRQPGPPTQNIADYRTGESVGCEACHGPADEHLAAKGAPNTIQGLGDSCPVCIIEALCTSCHTPKEDPLWSLERGLKATVH